MSVFFEDIKKGLEEAIQIEKGEKNIVKKDGFDNTYIVEIKEENKNDKSDT